MKSSTQRLITKPALLLRTWNIEHGTVTTVEISTSEPAIEIADDERASLVAYMERKLDPTLGEVRQELLDKRMFQQFDECRPTVCGYHAATRDHPFLDMSAGHEARQLDNDLMVEYSAGDTYPDVYLDLVSDVVFPLENYRDLELAQLWSDPSYMLSLMISGTFGERRHLGSYHDPYWNFRQVELIFKPIPSGGARHPTEAFFSIEKSTHIPVGTYHFNVRRNALTRIAKEPLQDVLPDTRRDSTATEVMVVLLGSMVERAMFRYRDPRSFRALLVDVGHADAQLGALAAFCNWGYDSQVLIDMEDLPVRLGLSGDVMPILLGGVLQGWS